eukprot:gene2378-2843_t
MIITPLLSNSNTIPFLFNNTSTKTPTKEKVTSVFQNSLETLKQELSVVSDGYFGQQILKSFCQQNKQDFSSSSEFWIIKITFELKCHNFEESLNSFDSLLQNNTHINDELMLLFERILQEIQKRNLTKLKTKSTLIKNQIHFSNINSIQQRSLQLSSSKKSRKSTSTFQIFDDTKKALEFQKEGTLQSIPPPRFTPKKMNISGNPRTGIIKTPLSTYTPKRMNISGNPSKTLSSKKIKNESEYQTESKNLLNEFNSSTVEKKVESTEYDMNSTAKILQDFEEFNNSSFDLNSTVDYRNEENIKSDLTDKPNTSIKQERKDFIQDWNSEELEEEMEISPIQESQNLEIDNKVEKKFLPSIDEIEEEFESNTFNDDEEESNEIDDYSSKFGRMNVLLAENQKTITPLKRSLRIQKQNKTSIISNFESPKYKNATFIPNKYLPDGSKSKIIVENVICNCNGNENGKIIKCSSSNCSGNVYYHLSCVGLKIKPSKEWYCDQCKD